ncbi:MAG: tRNA (adenosine(37)-N6)-dimethylallyltransferase MiaA [Bacteroidetes bacterium]|nr:MAG: tRNA (adenosine(37)-N6)-dimethylallyltransferase MiaA [Bacteroidota bacterium]
MSVRFSVDIQNGRLSTNDFLISGIKSLIVITGPTASGKTALSVELAKVLKTVVISADSRQFYREMSIGTAKPSSEEMKSIPHYFIDSHLITQELSAATYAKEARALIETLQQDVCIVTGGSGMFIDALTKGLDDIPHDDIIRDQLTAEWQNDGSKKLIEELKLKDPEYAAEVDIHNPSRVIRALTAIRISGKKFSDMRTGKVKDDFNVIRFVIDIPRELLYQRINKRVDLMMEAGLLEEVKAVLDLNNNIVSNTVGYKEFIPYFNGEIELDEAIEIVKRNSRRYAKRQLTWCRRYEDAIWVPYGSTHDMVNFIEQHLNEIISGME